MSVYLIGITGKARSGKDTLANELCSRWRDEGDDKLSEKKSFASPLYDIAEVFHFDTLSPTFKTDIHPVLGVTGRDFLQKVGTDLFRNHFDKDVWIKLAQCDLGYRIKSHERCNLLLVYPDVRFDNEAKFIKDNGGIVISVKRPDSPLALHGDEAKHVSESGISDYLVDIQWLNEENRLDVMEKFAKNVICDIIKNNQQEDKA